MNPSVKTFEGRVDSEDPSHGFYRVRIGGRDVAEELADAFPGCPQVRATLWVESEKSEAEGEMFAREGEWGYGTYTPGCGPEVRIGDFEVQLELIDELDELDGKVVALLVERL